MKISPTHYVARLILLALLWAHPGLGQDAHTFGGITLMQVHHDDIHQAVGINPGFRNGQPSMLMTVVAGGRSYASVTKGSDRVPGCMTWITPESLGSDKPILGTGDRWRISGPDLGTTTFGGDRMICAEFELRRLGPDQALFIKDDLEIVLPIVANIPIVEIDWSDPAIRRFSIGEYKLGPVSRSEARKNYKVPALDEVLRSKEKHGRLSGLGSSGSQPGGIHSAVSMLADVERLLKDGRAEIVYMQTQRAPSSTLDRFGKPSVELPISPSGALRIWAHDLRGRLLSVETDMHHPCLNRVLVYAGRSTLPTAEIDAFNCGVVAIMNRNFLYVFHGHAIAHYILADRMNLMDIARSKQPVVKSEEKKANPVSTADHEAHGDYLPVIEPVPVYPPRALSRGVEGEVTVEFTVTSFGSVTDIVVADSTSSIFDRAARNAASQLSYEPKMIDGVAVDVPGVSYTFTFKLDQ